MFDKLTERLQGVIENLRGRGRLTEDNITDTLRQVRMALLEADVALPVVKSFVETVKAKVVGQEILLAGLQGAGKTTSAAKLAKWLKDHERKRVLLASTDVYRPAAILQLQRLAEQLDVAFHPSDPKKPAVTLAREAYEEAKRSLFDVLIVDTAGRLHVDDEMMGEIREIDAVVDPTETLFVVDSMAGQDAVNAARAFGAALDLTGVVLTKPDGDARGGAALSVRQITGKPILFMGTGEKTDALEPFHAERVAARILGMGDVLSLVENVTRTVDREQAEKLARKLKKGKDFDLEDLHDQLLQVEKMGGLASLMDKLPSQLVGKAAQMPQPNDKEIKRQVAIIRSMTPSERRYPKTIDASRKRRIAAGSGVHVSEINRLLKNYLQMQKVMKSMTKGGGLAKMMRAFGGRLPGM